MSDNTTNNTESGLLFYELLILLREIIRSQLGYAPNPETGETKKDIKTARHLVDMISVLKEKTDGNLSEQEQLVIDNLLTELRMACVRAIDNE